MAECFSKASFSGILDPYSQMQITLCGKVMSYSRQSFAKDMLHGEKELEWS